MGNVGEHCDKDYDAFEHMERHRLLSTVHGIQVGARING